MPARNYYKPGDWNAICDRCGFKFKASELKKDWQGLMVCVHDFELRHPLDFLRVRPDNISVPWVRKEAPTEITTTAVIEQQPLGSQFLGETTLGGP